MHATTIGITFWGERTVPGYHKDHNTLSSHVSFLEGCSVMTRWLSNCRWSSYRHHIDHLIDTTNPFSWEPNTHQPTTVRRIQCYWNNNENKMMKVKHPQKKRGGKFPTNKGRYFSLLHIKAAYTLPPSKHLMSQFYPPPLFGPFWHRTWRRCAQWARASQSAGPARHPSGWCA